MRADRWSALRLRAALYACVRQFFADRGVLEVETPILSAAGNTDPNIESFSTRFSGHVDAGPSLRWLRTSPEFPLKRLLAAGLPDCYELGRVFRNGESGRNHNPEFTLLEWYRLGFDVPRLADEVLDLLDAAAGLVGRRLLRRRMSYRTWFLESLGVDPFGASIEALQNAAGSLRIDAAGLQRDDWLDLIITHRLQPSLDPELALIVHDFPASQCALARIVERDGLAVAERFECYLGGRELANGYHELNDPLEQRRRFERDQELRRQRGTCVVPIDLRLLNSLGSLPDCAGVALGMDRLLQVLAGEDAIADVLAFPFADA